jgi:hypothetical protein
MDLQMEKKEPVLPGRAGKGEKGSGSFLVQGRKKEPDPFFYSMTPFFTLFLLAPGAAG